MDRLVNIANPQEGILLTIFNLGVFYFHNKDFANNIHLTLGEYITR